MAAEGGGGEGGDGDGTACNEVDKAVESFGAALPLQPPGTASAPTAAVTTQPPAAALTSSLSSQNPSPPAAAALSPPPPPPSSVVVSPAVFPVVYSHQIQNCYSFASPLKRTNTLL